MSKRPSSIWCLAGPVLSLVLGIAAGCGDSAKHNKDKVFTKMRGPNVGALDGNDVDSGECTADEKGKAACYGNVLIHCSDDGEAHWVDCGKKLGTDVCNETDTTADCECSKQQC